MTVNNDIGRRRDHITDMRVVLFFFSASQKKENKLIVLSDVNNALTNQPSFI